MRTGPIPLLWLCGPPGAGKSCVGWDIYSRLARDGAHAAFADIDQLGICYPEPPSDPGRYRMKERNLAAVIEGFRAAGSECVVVSGVVDPSRGVPADAVLGTGEFAAARVDTTALTAAEVARLIPARCGGWPGHGRAEPENASRSPGATMPDTTGLDGRALLVCGATGTGKSAVGFEVYRRHLAAGQTAAYADLDQLGFCRPDPGDPGRHRLKARNLGVLWRTYQATGARFLVATGPIPDRQASAPTPSRSPQRTSRCVGCTPIPPSCCAGSSAAATARAGPSRATRCADNPPNASVKLPPEPPPERNSSTARPSATSASTPAPSRLSRRRTSFSASCCYRSTGRWRAKPSRHWRRNECGDFAGHLYQFVIPAAETMARAAAASWTPRPTLL